MQSREATLKSPVWRGRENEIRPFGNPKASDSANLDSAAEVLSCSFWLYIFKPYINWHIKVILITYFYNSNNPRRAYMCCVVSVPVVTIWLDICIHYLLSDLHEVVKFIWLDDYNYRQWYNLSSGQFDFSLFSCRKLCCGFVTLKLVVIIQTSNIWHSDFLLYLCTMYYAYYTKASACNPFIDPDLGSGWFDLIYYIHYNYTTCGFLALSISVPSSVMTSYAACMICAPCCLVQPSSVIKNSFCA